MDFLFTFPMAMVSLTAERKRLVAEIEMKAVIDFADARDKEDYGIVSLHARDLNKSIHDDWFELDPTTEGYSIVSEWIAGHAPIRERLEDEWEEHCLNERLTVAPSVHEHSTHWGRP